MTAARRGRAAAGTAAKRGAGPAPAAAYARIFKALANEQRLKIFMMIYRAYAKGAPAAFPVDAACCCPVDRAFTMVCACMQLSRSTVSHHFKELQQAGLITCERDGKCFRCRVNEPVLAQIREFLA
ncbi:MAG TPA: metalloregulator ArsR/SmtB family transcription factor [bacterium]|nr:metalloregulator ArsR/SmtB family transcription factor [bacterium]